MNRRDFLLSTAGLVTAAALPALGSRVPNYSTSDLDLTRLWSGPDFTLHHDGRLETHDPNEWNTTDGWTHFKITRAKATDVVAHSDKPISFTLSGHV